MFCLFCGETNGHSLEDCCDNRRGRKIKFSPDSISKLFQIPNTTFRISTYEMSFYCSSCFIKLKEANKLLEDLDKIQIQLSIIKDQLESALIKSNVYVKKDTNGTKCPKLCYSEDEIEVRNEIIRLIDTQHIKNEPEELEETINEPKNEILNVVPPTPLAPLENEEPLPSTSTSADNSVTEYTIQVISDEKSSKVVINPVINSNSEKIKIEIPKIDFENENISEEDDDNDHGSNSEIAEIGNNDFLNFEADFEANQLDVTDISENDQDQDDNEDDTDFELDKEEPKKSKTIAIDVDNKKVEKVERILGLRSSIKRKRKQRLISDELRKTAKFMKYKKAERKLSVKSKFAMRCPAVYECRYRTERASYIESHLQWSHKGFNCSECRDFFYSHGEEELGSPELKQHIEEHRKRLKIKERIQCETCGATFAGISNLKAHISRMHRPEECKFPCTFEGCNKGFISKGHLKAHENTHTKTYKWLCEYCSKGFHQKCKMLDHKAGRHRDKEPDLPSTECKECNVHYSTHASLRKHIKDVHNPEKHKYFCQFCPKSFVLDGDFRIHIMRHNKDYKYTCEICSKQFYTKYDLDEHMTKHTGERKLDCSYCDMKFKARKALKNHEKIRHLEKLFECLICTEKFPLKLYVKNHMKSAHKITDIEGKFRKHPSQNNNVNNQSENLQN